MRPDNGGRVPERSANRSLDMGHASETSIRHLDDSAMRRARARRIISVTSQAAALQRISGFNNRDLGIIAGNTRAAPCCRRLGERADQGLAALHEMSAPASPRLQQGKGLAK